MSPVALIIGNGVAGTTAAETIRKQDERYTVILVTDEPHPLYNRTILPHAIKLMIPDERVFMRSPDSLSAMGIDFRPNTRVASVSPEQKIVTTATGETIEYDTLLIATGGRPQPMGLASTENGSELHLQYFEDACAIKKAVPEASSAVAIGGGFIGYEFASAFAARRLKTTWLIRGPRFYHRYLDEPGGAIVDLMAKEAGIEMVYDDEVSAVEPANGRARTVSTANGRTIDADLIGCGFGLQRNLEFLEGSGIEVRQGVVVDRYLRATAPDVYAAGDVAEFEDVAMGGKRHVMGTWSNAALHGRAAAINMLGGNQEFFTLPVAVNPLFYSHIRFFGLSPDLDTSGLETISQLDVEARKYRKLFFDGDVLVGAIVIGPFMGQSKNRLLALMRSKEPVRDRQSLLSG